MSRTRTFLGIELSDAIRGAAVELQNDLARTGVEVKWTEPDNLHVTLIFLGEVDNKEIPNVCRLVSKGVQETAPFRMTVETAGCFPHPRRPRILWIGVGQGSEELCRIHDSLETALMDLGYRRENRKYTPHVTLGRVKSDRPTEKLAAALAKNAGWTGGDAAVSEIHIMGSELTPKGPVYTILGRAKLAGPSEQRP